MAKDDESLGPGWGASFFVEDVAKAVAAVASTSLHSPRPSIVFSSKDDKCSSPLQRLQQQLTEVVKGFSPPPEVKSRTYNPEVLTSQKRQWATFQLQSLDHRHLKEPTRLFENMVVVGLHPNCNIRELQNQYIGRKSEGSGKFRIPLSSQNQSRVEPNLEPQVLFVYPPEKQLPLKYKDFLSFCFPAGVEVHAVERTPSMSELNEILLGQEHLKQSDQSFVFRLQVADDSTLYGCCVLVDEVVQKPPRLVSMISDKKPSHLPLSRHILTTRRCYCILSRLPFFELHFGVLNSIFIEERLEWLTKNIDLEEKVDIKHAKHGNYYPVGTEETFQLGSRGFQHGEITIGRGQQEQEGYLFKNGVDDVVPVENGTKTHMEERESGTSNTEDMAERESGNSNTEGGDICANDFVSNKQTVDRQLPSAVLPLLRYYQYESSESSSSFQGSPGEDRNFRSDIDDTETEASFSGQEDSIDHSDILEWAKAHMHGSLQIICEYYCLSCPSRGSIIRFHPLEHLHPLEYNRPYEKVISIAGSNFDLESCCTSLELAEAHNALLTEEEATALSIWAVACICGTLRLENVLTLFAGALLEKQIVVVCSNLGILSASVLSIIPLIRPYQWQSLLMPVLPNDMLDFLDAPVPYIVGVKNKTAEVQSKLSNVILVDANKNQVKSSTIPQLPQKRELFSSLSPYHSKLVGESYLGRKRPVYECTDVQIEAAKGFLAVLRSYLDSLCSNIRSHTITNVQSNDDKVSLLLKESFIESFPNRDRPFMKLFVDTQLFSVRTDLVLSVFQKQ